MARPLSVARSARRLPALALIVLLVLVAACASPEDGLEEVADPDQRTADADADADADAAGDGDGDGDGTEAGGDRSEGGQFGDDAFEPSIDQADLLERLSGLRGRLAVGNGPELLIARPDGAATIPIDGSEVRTATQPTWSADGSLLAWSLLSAVGQVVRVQDFDDEGLPAGDPIDAEATGNPIFYLQWAEDDSALAYLRNAAATAQVEMGTIEPGGVVEPVAAAAPFFISWSPDSTRLVGHLNETSMEVFEVGDGDEFREIRQIEGTFSAPAWVDDGRAVVADGSTLGILDVASGEIEPLVELAGPVRFVLSPDRTRLAYQTVGGGGVSAASLTPDDETATGSEDLEGTELTVLELESGRSTAITADPTVAFEWSPDSDKLAYLQLVAGGSSIRGRWSFWSRSGAAPATSNTVGFEPSRKVSQAYLPFFAQYTQSVTRWSPDSTAFAFAAAIGTERGIWVQLIDERVRPVKVADGDFVTWGDGVTPPPIGDVGSVA